MQNRKLTDVKELMERISRNDDLPWNLDDLTKTVMLSCLRSVPVYQIDLDNIVRKIYAIDFNKRNAKKEVAEIIRQELIKAM